MVATWRNVGVFYWQAAITLDAVALLDRTCVALDSASPSGFSGVHLFKRGVGLPGPEVRKQLQVVMSHYGRTSGCMAVVILDGGFVVAALQSLITGLRMVAGPSPPLLRFARELNELPSWLPFEHLERTGQRIDPTRLMAVIEQVRNLGDKP